MPKHVTRTMLRGATVLLALALAALALSPSPARAETAWVKDELRLNLRTGPGTQFRIIGVIKSGDRVEILERRDGWTQVRPRGEEAGWIPEGYLQPTIPARIRLSEAEAQLAELHDQLDRITAEAERLKAANENLEARDAERSAAMEKLTRENQAYRAAADWGGYITGAAILAAGMLVGWLLKSGSGRGRSPRVRL